MYPVSIDLGLAEYKGFIVYHKVGKVNILCKKFKNIYSHLYSGGVQYTLKIHKLKSLVLPIAQPFLQFQPGHKHRRTSLNRSQKNCKRRMSRH